MAMLLLYVYIILLSLFYSVFILLVGKKLTMKQSEEGPGGSSKGTVITGDDCSMHVIVSLLAMLIQCRPGPRCVWVFVLNKQLKK
jgi:hypothetical protein